MDCYSFVASHLVLLGAIEPSVILCNLAKINTANVAKKLQEAEIAAHIPAVNEGSYQLYDDHYVKWAAAFLERSAWKERKGFRLWRVLRDGRIKWFESQKINKTNNTITKSNGTAIKKYTKAKPPFDTDVKDSNKRFRGPTVYSDIDLVDGDIFDEDDVDYSLQDKDTNIYRQCDFCDKETIVYERTGNLLDRLTGGKGFFCPFCVNHGFHTRKRYHILHLTFRSIIAYLYQACYYGKKPQLYLGQIQDLINLHVQIGQLNPVFSYDADTFSWFIDFTHVGNSKKKIKVEEILRTINEIISAFNPFEHIKDFKSFKLISKYEEAVLQFYSKRYRPEGKKLLAPTLIGCAAEMRETANINKDKKLDLMKHRDFLPGSLRLHPRR